MFNETSYLIECDDGLSDTLPTLLTPSQQKKYEALIRKGKTEKAAKKAARWAVGQPSIPVGGIPTGKTPTDGAPGGSAPQTPATDGEKPMGSAGFLEGEVMGIPILYIALGIGAFLLLKKR